MDIVQRLVAHLKETRTKVPTVTAATGIDGARIHKWIQGKAMPKHEDSILLEKYLKGEKLPNVEKRPTGEIDYQAKYIESLEKQIALLESKIKLEELANKAMSSLGELHQMVVATAINSKINRRLVEVWATGKKSNFAQEADKITHAVAKEYSEQGIQYLVDN